MSKSAAIPKKRRREQSTQLNPFETFREFSAPLTTYEDVLAGTGWTSPLANQYQVDWDTFLSGTAYPLVDLKPGLITFGHFSELPIASLLVFYTGSLFDRISQALSAPSLDEIGEKLRLLRGSLEDLGAIAQGNGGGTPIDPRPKWYMRPDEDQDRQLRDEFVRAMNGRTPSLHPLLQDHLPMAFAAGADQDPDLETGEESDVEYDERIKKLKEKKDNLVSFFERIPELIEYLQLAEEMCSIFPELTGKPRSAGAPEDLARNWALIRLMWVWRDVFEKEIKIYLRKRRGRVELIEPEPTGCMAFVVDALRSFAPVGAHEFASLELAYLNFARKCRPLAC